MATELPLHLKIRKAVRTQDSAALLSLLVSPPTAADTTPPIAPWIAYEACRQGATDVLRSLLQLRDQNAIGVLSPQQWNLDDWIDTTLCGNDEDDEDTPVSACTTLLVQAATLPAPACVALLLARGANPWQPTEAGDLPLWQASRYGRILTVQCLLTATTSPKALLNLAETTTKDWATRALQEACQFGHLDVVQYFVSHSGVVSLACLLEQTTVNDRGWNLWFHAAWAGQIHILQWLWALHYQQQNPLQMNGGNSTFALLWLRDARGGTWMHRATAGCHVRRILPIWEFIAQQLSSWSLSTLPTLILATDHDGDSSLSAAAWEDRIEILEWLLVQLRQSSTTGLKSEIQKVLQHAIFRACENDQAQVLPLLLKHYPGTMENQRCAIDGMTCLDKAILWGYNEIVQLLTGPQYRYRVTVTHTKAARQLGRLECLHMLLRANPELVKATYAKGGESNNLLLVTIPMCQPGKHSDWEYTWYLINLIVEKGLHKYFEQTNVQGKTAREMAIFTKSYATAAVLSDPLLTCRTAKEVEALLGTEDTIITEAALCRPRMKPPKGWTCLHTACCLGRLEIVDYLLHLPNVNVTAATTQGMTPLHWAARHGHVDICRRLLALYQEPDVQKSIQVGPASKQSPLWGPARHGHAKIVQLLVDTGFFDVNALDEDENSALYMATAEGHEDVVAALLGDVHNIDPNSVNTEGETCLQRACLDQHEGIVQQLLQAGAKPNTADAETGETALHYAAACGFGDRGSRILALLLDHQADFQSMRQRDNWTPLHCAVWAHREELFWQESSGGLFPTIRLLVHWGARLDAVDINEKTPMDIAIHPTLRLYLESLLREQTPNRPIY